MSQRRCTWRRKRASYRHPELSGAEKLTCRLCSRAEHWAWHSPVGEFFLRLNSRKKPSHEVDGGDSHADAEQHSDEYSLRPAFAQREGQARNHDCDERKAACDSAGERLHQDVYCVLPGRAASRLSEYRRGK